MIGQQVALIRYRDACLHRAPPHARPQADGRLTEHDNLASRRASSAPTRRKGHYGAILRNEWSHCAQPALENTELDQRAAGREDQLGVRGHPGHVSGRDSQPVVPIE
jgi:hypothetical protein